MDDLALDREYQRGDQGVKVSLIQEWLCLHGFQVVIDGAFGPATEAAVGQFQSRAGVGVDGIVGDTTFEQLVLPMKRALGPIPPDGANLGAMVVAYAKQHLAQAPREVGGQNRGPWVRLYVNGHDGPEWPRCAGFASFILTQACSAIRTTMAAAKVTRCASVSGATRARTSS